MKNTVIYIHGKGGSAAESEHYKPLFPDYDVIGLDYKTFTPWETGKEIHAAVGDGGNVIYVNIEQNISIGVTGTFKPRVFDRIEFIEKNILPLIS